VILTRVSGPGGNAFVQPGDGGIGGTGTWACAIETVSKAMAAAVANRTSRVRMTFLRLVRKVAKHGAPKNAERDMA
jgi:hypothetical protein